MGNVTSFPYNHYKLYTVYTYFIIAVKIMIHLVSLLFSYGKVQVISFQNISLSFCCLFCHVKHYIRHPKRCQGELMDAMYLIWSFKSLLLVSFLFFLFILLVTGVILKDFQARAWLQFKLRKAERLCKL